MNTDMVGKATSELTAGNDRRLPTTEIQALASRLRATRDEALLIGARGADLQCTDLHEADFHGADLRGTNLSSADLNGADLNGADLSEANLNGADLSRANLSGANLSGANLSGANLSGANLSEARLRNTNISHATLSDANLGRATFIEVDLRNTSTLNQANLSGTHLTGANLSGANLSGANLSSAHLNYADLSGANLSGAALNRSADPSIGVNGASLVFANLAFANLSGADLSGTCFDKANLRQADLRGCRVSVKTSFNDAQVVGSQIERYVLEQLDDDYGGLKRSDRLSMTILDDVATLRSEFSGFMQWLQVGGIVAFIAPYIAHMIAKTAMSYPYDCSAVDCEPLLAELWHYAWSRQPAYEKVIFLFWVSYNFSRGALLFKTKKLEMAEAARQLPVLFSFSNHVHWARLYKFVHWGFWFHALAVLLHLAIYMATPVPK